MTHPTAVITRSISVYIRRVLRDSLIAGKNPQQHEQARPPQQQAICKYEQNLINLRTNLYQSVKKTRTKLSIWDPLPSRQ